nr:ABC transporter permease [Aureimonas fodinaquatilis]
MRSLPDRPAPARTAIRRRPRQYGTLIYGLPLMAFLLLVWEIAPRLDWISPIFFPPISAVAERWVELAANGDIWRHTSISLQRTFTGFFLAVAVAIPLGFLMGYYPLFEKITDFFVQTLRNTSQFALLPVFILVFGIGEASKVAVTFYSAVFFLLINTIAGVKSVDPLLIRAAKSMGTSSFDLFRKVILPASIPSIVAGARLAVKASIFAVIAAEMLAANSGLGYLVQHSQLMMQTTDMYSGIITLTAIGLIINYLLVWGERRATAWNVPAGNTES